jgi:hypothetical protein
MHRHLRQENNPFCSSNNENSICANQKFVYLSCKIIMEKRSKFNEDNERLIKVISRRYTMSTKKQLIEVAQNIAFGNWNWGAPVFQSLLHWR